MQSAPQRFGERSNRILGEPDDEEDLGVDIDLFAEVEAFLNLVWFVLEFFLCFPHTEVCSVGAETNAPESCALEEGAEVGDLLTCT